VRSRPARVSLLLATTTLFALAGCKSPYITATVINNTGGQVTLVEVDYPSASFGRDILAAGATYPYRFKIIGSGPTKVSWTDAAHHDHASAGPDLHERQQGQLAIKLTPAGASWSTHLNP
jgi:hypothetical protein